MLCGLLLVLLIRKRTCWVNYRIIRGVRGMLTQMKARIITAASQLLLCAPIVTSISQITFVYHEVEAVQPGSMILETDVKTLKS